jgi:hypothetical protein
LYIKPKSASFRPKLLAEAQPRLENRRGQKALLVEEYRVFKRHFFLYQSFPKLLSCLLLLVVFLLKKVYILYIFQDTPVAAVTM